MTTTADNAGAPATAARIRWPLWCVLALTFVGFALRAYRLGYAELRGDEAFGLLFSSQGLGAVLQQTLQNLEPHPPLDYALLHFWMGLAGNSEWAVRFTSLVFGVLAIPLIYRLGRVLHSEELGLWAAALLALSPFQLLHAQEARMYAISTALGVASSLALLGAMKLGRRRDWVAYVILSVLSIYTHYYALFLLVGQAVYWLLVTILSRRTAPNATAPAAARRPDWRAWLAAQAAIVLLYVPWLIVGWSVLTAYHGNGDSPAFFDMLGRTLFAFSLGQTISPVLAAYVLPLFALAALVGLVLLVRQRPPSALFAALYLAVPVLSVYFASLNRPVFNERYLAAAAPPFYLLVGAGLIGFRYLLGKRARALTYVLAAVILVSGLYSLYGYFFDTQYTRNRGWRELAAQLQQSTAPGDVIVQNYPDPTMWYYYHGSTPHEVVPAVRPASYQDTTATLDRLGASYDRLWFVPYKSADWDAEGMVGTWLDRHYQRVSEEPVQALALRQYLTPRTFLTDAVPVNVQWGDQIALRGYKVEPSTGNVTNVHYGDTMTVTFYWEALRKMDIDYTVFVHLVGPGARIVSQRDNQPVGGTFPTSTWQPGEIVVDKYVIILPWLAQANYAYSLNVGFYRAPVGSRLLLAPGSIGEFPDRYVLLHDVNILPTP